MKSDILEIRHPVPVSFLRRRGGRLHTDLAETMSRVAIPHISPSSVRPGTSIGHRSGSHRFAEIEGRLFLDVTGRGNDETVDELLAKLARPGDIHRISAFGAAIARTPLAAEAPHRDAEGRPNLDVSLSSHRGLPASVLRARDVVEDGTAAARARLVAWVGANVRVAGDALYVDTGGPLLRAKEPGGSLAHRVLAFPRIAPVRGNACRGR